MKPTLKTTYTVKEICEGFVYNQLEGKGLFGLKRYNGDSHEHTNRLEGEKVNGCHIHHATERYQDNGFREEDYAKKTTKYNDWKKALDVMLAENNFQLAVPKGQRRLS